MIGFGFVPHSVVMMARIFLAKYRVLSSAKPKEMQFTFDSQLKAKLFLRLSIKFREAAGGGGGVSERKMAGYWEGKGKRTQK